MSEPAQKRVAQRQSEQDCGGEGAPEEAFESGRYSEQSTERKCGGRSHAAPSLKPLGNPQAGGKQKIAPAQQADADGAGAEDSRHMLQKLLRLERNPQRSGRQWFVMHPDSRFKTNWDWFVVSLVIAVAFATPYQVAFTADPKQCGSSSLLWPVRSQLSRSCQEGLPPAEALAELEASGKLPPGSAAPQFSVLLPCASSWMQKLDLVIDALFWADIAITFVTGFHLPRCSAIELRPRAIAARYARSWLLVDLLSVFPFENVARAAEARYEDGDNWLVFDMFKLSKLLRLSRISRKLDQLAAATIFRIARLLFLYVLVAHWVACGFFFQGRWQVENLKGGVNEYTGEPWLIEECLHYADDTTQFSVSLYWAFTTMTTVGYGDILPHTNVDKNYTMLIMLISGVLQAIIFGSVAALLAAMYSSTSRLQEKLREVTEMQVFYQMPADLGQRIKDSVEYTWNEHQGVQAESVMALIPSALRGQLWLALRGRITQRMSVCEGCPPGFLKLIAASLQMQTFVPNDAVVVAGDVADALFYVDDGVCCEHEEQQVSSASCADTAAGDPAGRERGQQPRWGRVLRRGEQFGDVEMVLELRHACTVRTVTYCTLAVLTRLHLQHALGFFPELHTPLLHSVLRRRGHLGRRRRVSDTAQLQGPQPQLVGGGGAAALERTPQPAPAHLGSLLDQLRKQAERLLEAELLAAGRGAGRGIDGGGAEDGGPTGNVAGASWEQRLQSQPVGSRQAAQDS